MRDAETTELIFDLVEFAIEKGFAEAEDRRFYRNRLFEALQIDAPAEIVFEPKPAGETATPILEPLLDIACTRGLASDTFEGRDLFSAKLMGLLTPEPALVRERFAKIREAEGIERATDWFYRLCRDCDYIRVDRIAKNVRFLEDTAVGRLEITINLSKPEKDPRDIAAARQARDAGYPKCMLCAENPGYAGRAGFPARQNHRMLPMALGGQPWHLQFSPYLYYGEHLIALNDEHVPMRVSRESIARMFDFVDQFPHYFIGSNADLPIVGGSILNHDHFQGGRHRFPMDDALVRAALKAPRGDVRAWIVDWPMSCVRLASQHRETLIGLADDMLSLWREYSDPALGILARTDQPHNTITPILRIEGGLYRLDLVLRNNRASREHPLGIFHPHAELHHVKKENIGLIEVMGLFVLPGRLVSELAALQGALEGRGPAPEKHAAWAEELKKRLNPGGDAERFIRKGLGEKCAQVLTDAGVYKADRAGTEGFLKFLRAAGYEAT
ncbi:MAG: UDP-glucose--hexose-1-phosphate uridylyltransferase [Clostridiales bacterium]|nr:UDP-glucose--hexose-1-phosphate uridylyltransferase [Clostridiales bacterium]